MPHGKVLARGLVGNGAAGPRVHHFNRIAVIPHAAGVCGAIEDWKMMFHRTSCRRHRPAARGAANEPCVVLTCGHDAACELCRLGPRPSCGTHIRYRTISLEFGEPEARGRIRYPLLPVLSWCVTGGRQATVYRYRAYSRVSRPSHCLSSNIFIFITRSQRDKIRETRPRSKCLRYL